MKAIFALFLFVGFGVSSVRGADILWLNLKSIFSYRDLSTACSNKYYPTTLYFGAEVQGLEIKRAVIQDTLLLNPNKIELTAEELKDVVLHQDKNGQLWLKTISMNARLLTWLFSEAGGSAVEPCKPPQTVTSVDPISYAFQFKIETIPEEAKSSLGQFRGTLKDGSAYQAELQFTEKPYQLYSTDF